MASLLGLSTTEDFAAQRYKSVRRKVFYDYPNGAAPLIGLSSLMEEEACSDPEFSWFEKRVPINPTGAPASASGADGPFLGAAAGTKTWGSTLRNAGGGIDAGGATAVGDHLTIKVTDTTNFRIGHVVRMDGLTMNSGSKGFLVARVAGFNGAADVTTTTNPKAAGRLDVIILNVTAVGIKNTDLSNVTAMVIRIVGSSFAQGAIGSSNATHTQPIEPTNNCQIFRAKFGVTGTAKKTPIRWDRNGAYRDKAKEASIQHMMEMERAAIFGHKSKLTTAGDPTEVQYTTGGILWYLQQWEAGTDYGVTAATLDSDDNKRIIENTSGDLSEKLYDKYLERAFRKTNNKANEKLALCGNGFLNVVNQMYKSKSCLTADLPLADTYGMDVVKHRTPFGTVYYKTHPLFNDDTELRFAALILDVGNLRYRYVEGRDTELLTNRQANDEDKQVSEFLTECGFEVRFPESHMFIKNVQDYTP